ncbi:MAG: DUF378 domain-containing protein [Candidatus Eisenbacteria bacterium]|uniref:DUF378 domain-containing protein n=1 Tax=Eiseniibacteriota bacterium TaxID=2212470 RepID=A0A948RV66_UNCEI|nr:DUF378 domain-containing protein [Candidatus Eisenbacteria bacterium]MBU1948777.1 DUF378 domain-containing protein [Candidatus Eisenbacteria bacterium]MBU2691610.1 DUF378 domain-containing protein [Candidatus Eisenbacteria bacterium]
MKAIDIIVATLLVVGGLNWGLVGFFNFDLVESIFGSMSGMSRVVYILVGFAAVYQVAFLKSLQDRWAVNPHF